MKCTPRRSKARSIPKLPFLSLQMLEGRDVPATLIADPTFDSNTPGWQVTAFNKVSDAFAIATLADDITINAGNFTTVDPATANLALDINVTVSGAAQVSAIGATTGKLILNGDLTVGNAANTSIASVISGSSKFIKAGAGKITLSAANSTYAGEVNVNAGTLAVTNIAALGTTAGVTIVGIGGTLEAGTTGTIAEPVTLEGDGATAGLGALRNTSSVTWSGAITIGSTGARINSAANTFAISGAIGIAGNTNTITFGGTAAMTITGTLNSALAGQVNLDGGNVVTVSGTNGTTLVSPILVSNGTEIQFPASTNLGSTAGSGLLTLDNGTLTNTTTTGVPTFLNVNRTINLAPGGGTLAGSGTAFGIYTGRITGTGDLKLHKPGTPTTTILGFTDAANNTDYVGNTIIQGGTVRLRTNAEVFSKEGALTVNTGGVFDFTVLNAAQTFKGLNGGGNLVQSSSTGGNLTITGPAATTNTFSGTIVGTTIRLTLTAANESTQVITSANTNTGVTTVNGGTLVYANSTGFALGTGTATVAAIGTIASPSTSNNGIIGSTVTLNGTMAPGNLDATGRLTVGNSKVVTFGATSIFDADLRGTTAGFGVTGFDQLVTDATPAIIDGAKLNLDLTGYTPNFGDVYRVIDNIGTGVAITGRFRDANGVLLDQFTEFTVDGKLFRISYTGGTGNDVEITRVAPSSNYYVRKDFNASAADLDSNIPGIQVDGDLVLAGDQIATVGVTAFDTIAAALAKTVDADKVIVNASASDFTYAEQVDLSSKFVFMTFQENPITINSIKGTNKFASITLGTKDGTTGILLTMGSDDQSVDLAATMNGPGGIVKIGNGTLTLNPVANTYTGSTSLATAGTGAIKAGSTGAFSASSPFDLVGGRLILNGFNSTIGNLTGDAASIVENDSTVADAILTAGSVATISGGSLDLNFAGTLRDGAASKTFGFVKIGAGTLTLPLVNNFTGPFGLQGGSYIVDTLPNGGIAGPFGKSTNAATNLRFGGGAKLTYTGAAIAAPGFDRNLTWLTGGATLDFTNDVTMSGTITASGTPGAFVKEGAGKLTFSATNAFQTANTLTTYGALGTGNVTVNTGELILQNFTARGAIAARSTVSYTGTRLMIVNSPGSVTIKNTLALDPDGTSYVNQVQGSGTLFLDNDSASKTNPTITFDSGPNVSNVGGGDARPFGSAITASVTLVGNEPVFITGKADRNDLNRHSGDLRINGKITGTAPIQFIGLSSTDSSRVNSANASNIHFVLNADNSTTYSGAVSLANADLALGAANALSSANSLTFNSVDDPNTRNRASLFLFGESFTLGSLNDISAVGTTSDIRNGAINTATGGTGTSSGNALGAQTDSTLTILQTVDGTFGGAITNGPNDNPESAVSTYMNLTFIKEGTAKLTLSGTSPLNPANISNPLAANITVNAGALIHNGTINTAAQTITVGVDGTFGGSGTVKAVAISGRLTAGTAGGAGLLKTGNISFPAAAKVVADVTGITAGTGYDQIQITGTVDLNNATLSVNNTMLPAPAVGTKFFLIDNDGTDPIVNTFQGLAQGDTFIAGNTKFQIYYDADITSGTLSGGNDACAVAVPNNVTPNVTGFIINNAAVQRSRLTNITVQFSGSVSPGSFGAPGDITLTRYAATSVGVVGTIVQTGATGANGLISVTQPGPLNELVLTFSNADASDVTSGVEFGSLSDGRWELAISSAGYVSGQPASPAGANIRRLFGDVDDNGTVDATDFSFFPAFGATVGSPFDYNNNNDIDSGTDFSQFGNRIGVTL